jgi:hypothetical protein
VRGVEIRARERPQDQPRGLEIRCFPHLRLVSALSRLGQVA